MGALAAAACVLPIASLQAVSLVDVMSETGTENLPHDVQVSLTFDEAISVGNSGTIKVFDASGGEVVSIDMSASTHSKNVGGTSSAYRYNYDPVVVDGNTAYIAFQTNSLSYGQTYYVTVDSGVIVDSEEQPFAGISDDETVRFSTRAEALPTGLEAVTVAQDGSADFATIQSAIDYAPRSRTTPFHINVMNGTYRELLRVESNKPFIQINGESTEGVVIKYLNNANRGNGSSSRALLRIDAGDFVMSRVTMINTTPEGGSQAETIENRRDRVVIRDSAFYSYQDTIRFNGSVYVYNSYIEGDVDYIWGEGKAYFEDCTIHSNDSGYITQIRNDATRRGFVFVDCTLTADDGVDDVWLSRINPGEYPGSEVVFINTQMGSHINEQGWLLNNADTAPTIRFVEYNSTDLEGESLDLSGRLADATTGELPAETDYTNPEWVLDWDPMGRTFTAAQYMHNAQGWSWYPALGWIYDYSEGASDAYDWYYSTRFETAVWVEPDTADSVYAYVHGENYNTWLWGSLDHPHWLWNFATQSWEFH
ncbi:MAG: pectinesterase family protein [Verrucomicrobiota bacterium JB022]|nr:pectinesterase family protein [Verrucomicrobiota bacterium JB022]